jgi:hypothetical protein
MSVAVCDTPCGEFEFLGHVRHKDGSLFQEGVIFDPAVLNDNGTIRLYYGMWWNFERDFDREESLRRQMSTFKMTREELEEIAEVIKGTNICILSDEIYAELTYGRNHVSIAEIDGMWERTIIRMKS